ncbi:hypothetical protein AMTRI_Chr09g13250 [Amborella trichopoda]
MEEANDASNVARAVFAALDLNSNDETRRAAVSYLESMKAGDVRNLASTSFNLVRKEWVSEIRLHGFKMLQHLVRLRWEELTTDERRNFASLTVNLISEMASPQEQWALKSQTAALIAEVVRREDFSLWQELLPSLLGTCNKGPIEAELIAMLLRWLPEDITVHNEDLEADRRRLLLRGLSQSLSDILPLLYSLLEKHFGAAVSEVQRGQLDVARMHAAAVTAALNAVNAYAEWAPVCDLAKSGLINACGFLLSSVEFRLHACEFFKIVSPRKKPPDASASEFEFPMRNIYQLLMSASKDFLCRSDSQPCSIDENEFEFAECICESMSSIGCNNLYCIAGDSSVLSLYLEQMLGYFRHFKLALHCHSLLFWLGFIRESVSKPKASVQISGDSAGSSFGHSDKENKGPLISIGDDCCSAILDVSFQRLLKKNVPATTSGGVLELWDHEFESKESFSRYRSRILELVRILASYKPVVAAVKISERIGLVFKSYSLTSLPSQDLNEMEGTQLALETVVSGIFDGSTESGTGCSPEDQVMLHSIMEELLRNLISLKWTDPAYVEILGRHLDALGPYLKCFPEAAGEVVKKIFELIMTLPVASKDPSTAGFRRARLQVCTSFLRIAKAADKSLLSLMKSIADTMAYLQGEGSLHRGEHNLLGEAFLVIASAAGSQQQQEALAWLLEPFSKQWTQLDWQNLYLADPMGIVRLCSDSDLMWSIYHSVAFFERALKRSGQGGSRRSTPIQQNNSSTSSESNSVHPIAPHISWMLPPLLRLLRCVHPLWSQSIVQCLPGQLRSAMNISQAEQVSLVGDVLSKSAKEVPPLSDGAQNPSDANKAGHTLEPNESDIRTWLKGIRESGYNVIGLSASIGDYFFRCLESQSVAIALMEHIECMEFRHIRQLIHSTLIPLIKSCPVDLWAEWLEKLLPPLFRHCQQALCCSWSNLVHEGRAKVPDICRNHSEMDLRLEVLEEKLLRDLTREICVLLSVLASPPLNKGLPSLDQPGSTNRMELSSLDEADAIVSNSLFGFALKHKDLAVPALQISIDTLSRPDGEAVSKVLVFCGATVILAALSTNNAELREFVAKDLFAAVIQGLTLESNVNNSGELVSLCREIFVHLADRNPGPKQVLLSLPSITSNDLLAFEDALAKTSSPKEQRQHMKSLLLLAAGNNLKALSSQKNINVITNVSPKLRNPAPNVNAGVVDGDVIGLAAIT